MAFSFKIPKPDDVKKTAASTRQKIMSSGGSFSGDEKSGKFSGRGVDGYYEVKNDGIIITITKKPLLYPVSAVQSAIEDYFRE
jgi:hypothetical protein